MKKKKKKITVNEDKAIQDQKKVLSSYFDRGMDKQKRNSAIVEAYKDGHTQASIAKEIGISDAMVCVVIKKLRFNT